MDDTSMATCVAPARRMPAIARASSSASGVVCDASHARSP
jgi:hypothetical protein